ncbi:MAG: hypothetical protein IJU78_00185 [Clostridia bacterium]|nr:hypothetical protein [Clostridia bacterium]
MNKRKWNIWLATLLLVLLTLTGYFAIAADYGSKGDPLVSLSYINDVLAPQTARQIDEAFAEKKQEFDAQIDERMREWNAEFDRKVEEYRASLGSAVVSDELVDAVADAVIARGGSGAASSSESWKVVKLEAGKTLTGEVGCEILLRIGSATCVAGGSPGLINLSAGNELTGGGSLSQNNLYIVTVKGRGIKTAGGCTVLVSGSYTID